MRNSSVPVSTLARDTMSNFSTAEAARFDPRALRSATMSIGEQVLKSDSGLLPIFPWQGENVRDLKAEAEAQEWRLFLSSLLESEPLLRAAVRAARIFWDVAVVRYPRLNLPVTSLIEDGLQLAWRSRDGKYIELEISRDGRYEWLFRDSRRDITTFGGPAVELPQEFTYYLTQHFGG